MQSMLRCNLSRFWINRFWTAICALWLACISVNQLSAWQATADKLVLEGPELENCEITVRYFKSRVISKAVSVQISLLQGKIEESIEPGFDGVEVFVQSRATPIRATLMAGTETVETEVLNEPGKLQVVSGKVGRVEFTPASIEPSQAELKLIQSLAQAIDDQSTTRQLVASNEQAQIDSECLDVFSREVRARIGALDIDKTVAGAVAWDLDQGRTLACVLYGQQGVCGLRLLLADNRLVNVQPNCPLLADDYFSQPIESKALAERAERLVKFLFEGQSRQAHELYAPQFRQQIKIEQLDQLSDTLQQRYGKKIQSIRLKRANLGQYDLAKKSCNLEVEHLIETDQGIRCISRVIFNISADRNRVGKAELAAIYVTQTFSSSHPRAARFTQNLLQGLQPQAASAVDSEAKAGGSAQPDSATSSRVTAQQLMDGMPEELAKIAQKEQLQAVLDRLARNLSGQAVHVDPDDWTVTQYEGHLQAAGPLKAGELSYYAEMQFVDDKFLGFSFYGPAIAESTLGLFDFPAPIGQTAIQFWTHLLEGDAESSHAMLDAEFKEQFPIEELKEQLSAPELLPSKLKAVTLDSLRLSQDVVRPVEVMVTVLMTAKFEDGQESQVSCDMPLLAEGQPAVYDFSNEISLDFPVAMIPLAEPSIADHPEESDQNSATKSASSSLGGSAGSVDAADALVAAFNSADIELFLRLVDGDQRQAIDREALTAYLSNLRGLLLEQVTPPSIARTVEYQGAVKRYRCNMSLPCKDQQKLPLEAWFYRGQLERFTVSHPKVNDFVGQIKDRSGIHQRVEAFVTTWLSDPSRSSVFLVSSLQNEATLQKLNRLQQQFQADFGKVSIVQIAKESVGQEVGELEFVVTVTAEKGSKEAKILVDVGAFGGLIAGVSLQ